MFFLAKMYYKYLFKGQSPRWQPCGAPRKKEDHSVEGVIAEKDYKGYEEMVAFRANVDPTIFEQGHKDAYVRFDLDEVLIVNQTHCGYLDFVIAQLSNSFNYCIINFYARNFVLSTLNFFICSMSHICYCRWVSEVWTLFFIFYSLNEFMCDYQKKFKLNWKYPQ
jgi:hypothetical protein